MAITLQASGGGVFDLATSTSTAPSVTAITQDADCNRVFIAVHAEGNAPGQASVTYDGVAAAFVAGFFLDSGTNDQRVDWFEVLAADLPAAGGGKTCSATFTGTSAGTSMAVVLLEGAGQGAVTGVNANGQVSSADVSENVTGPGGGGCILFAAGSGNGGTATGNTTQLYQLNNTTTSHFGQIQLNAPASAQAQNVDFATAPNRTAWAGFAVPEAPTAVLIDGDVTLPSLITSGSIVAEAGLVNTSSAATEGSASDSIQVPYPAALLDEDALLLFVTCNDASANVYSTPAGWTLVEDEMPVGGAPPTPPGTTLYTRRVPDAGTEPSTVLVQGTLVGGHTAQMLAFRGLNTGEIEVALGSATGNPDPPAITITEAGSFVVAVGWADTAQGVVAAPAGYDLLATNSTRLGAADGGAGTPVLESHESQADAVGTTITTLVPDGTTDGDTLLWVVAESESSVAGDIPTPAGWTIAQALTQTSADAPSRPGVTVFHRTASGEGASHTITGALSTGHTATMVLLREVSSGVPLDNTPTTAVGADGVPGQPDPPSLTVVTADAAVLAIGVRDGADDVNVHTPPAGYTLVASSSVSAGGNGHVMSVAVLEGAATGAENPGAFFIGADEEWAAITIALRPGVSIVGVGHSLATAIRENVGVGPEDPGPFNFELSDQNGAATISLFTGVQITGAVSLGPLVTVGALSAVVEVSCAVSLGALETTGSLEVPVEVSGAVSLGALTTTGSLEVPVQVSGAVSLPPLETAGSLNVTDTTFLSGAVSLAALTTTGSLEVPVEVSGSVSLGALETAGSLSPAVEVAGAVSLPPLETAGELILGLSLSGAVSLPPLETAGELEVPVQVTGAVSLPPLVTLGSFESSDVVLAGAVSLGALETAGSLEVPVEVAGGVSLGALEVAGSLEVPVEVSCAVSLAPLTTTGALEVPVQIAGDVALPALVTAGELEVPVQIAGAVALPALVTSGSIEATPPVAISGAVTLPALQTAGALEVPVQITGAVQLGALQTSGALFAVPVLTGAVQLGALQTAGVMTSRVILSGAVQLGALQTSGALQVARVGAGSGTMTISGTGSVMSVSNDNQSTMGVFGTRSTMEIISHD